MARKELSRDDQEQLDYIDAWWTKKREKKYQKLERRRTRRMHLEIACQLLSAAVAELSLIFKRK